MAENSQAKTSIFIPAIDEPSLYNSAHILNEEPHESLRVLKPIGETK